MQQYDIHVAANSTFLIAAAGRYIKYLAGNNGGGDVSLAVTPAGQGASKIVLVPGQAFRVSDAGPTPSGWVLSNNAGGATITGTVVVGDGRIDDPTINGTVQIVDGSKERTLANLAFSGWVSAGQANNYAQVQLWNPPTNTYRLIVEAVGMYAQSASNAYMTASVAALATVQEQGQPKLLGGTVSGAQLCSGYTASAPGQPENGSFSIVGGQSQSFVPHEPIIVRPGYGLLLTCNVVSINMTANFEWYEEPNV